MTRYFANIPTNLVIGFLGVGKTTAIRHLLTRVPQGERWGVLVNEFGEVGVDGALLEDGQAAVEEVFGGCLCCVASNGLQVGLNRLIRQYSPQRILIEPTGLGHPAQIIGRLTAPPFDQVLDLRATIALVDARQLRDPRYREHELFQDQLFLSDVLVANKTDHYAADDDRAFEDLLTEMNPAKALSARVRHGQLRPEWLDLPRTKDRQALFPEAHAWLQGQQPRDGNDGGVSDPRTADTAWLRLESTEHEGYHGCGWVISEDHVFDQVAVGALLTKLALARAKGVLNTTQGWFSFNGTRDDTQWRPVPGTSRSRIELLDDRPRDWSALDTELRQAVNSRTSDQP